MISEEVQENKILKKIKLKILLVGDATVGKTSVLLKYVKDTFSDNYLSTIGVELCHKEIKTEKYDIVLNIWDSAGQERFRAISKSCYQGSNGIIFVYDITKRQTFEGLKKWINDTELHGRIEKIICGNKVDLEKQREVPYQEVKEFGEKKEIEVFETSAKLGNNIENVFNRLVELILENKTDEEIIKLYGMNNGGERVTIRKHTKKNDKKKFKC